MIRDKFMLNIPQLKPCLHHPISASKSSAEVQRSGVVARMAALQPIVPSGSETQRKKMMVG